MDELTNFAAIGEQQVPITKGDVQIYYETRGSSDGIPMLFVQGFTWQLIGWREGFCQTFVDRGAFVILYDNRDVSLSQKFGGPDDYDGGYSLTDMASDGFSVLDHLGLASAHLVGASMGGMIAQIMALSQPSRVRSLNLIEIERWRGLAALDRPEPLQDNRCKRDR